THNPFAPPFDFLAKAFLPLLGKMGAEVNGVLERPGFYPAGGGKLRFQIKPANKLGALDLTDRGRILRRSARAIVANLPLTIAERELKVIGRKLTWAKDFLHAESVANSAGPGNVAIIEIQAESVTEVFTGFGQHGLAAEAVADQAAKAARRYIGAEVAVAEYLADQLLVPMAVGGGGAFTTLPLSRHASTNIEVIGKFLGEVVKATASERTVLVEVKSAH
ncbi:MAG TPA: RNA 3'-terminal phosphate cyclase, partial [Blastocatellia bacterium]